jgi:hypothetical protein
MTCLAICSFLPMRLVAPAGSAKKVASGGGVEAPDGQMITAILVPVDCPTDIFHGM